jgi:serine/threonine protein phosphatase PrpC
MEQPTQPSFSPDAEVQPDIVSSAGKEGAMAPPAPVDSAVAEEELAAAPGDESVESIEPDVELKPEDEAEEATPVPGSTGEAPMASGAPEPETLAPPAEAVLAPLASGCRLADRYEIVDLLEESPETLLYDALDHGRCAQCGFADSQFGDLFCADCGAALAEVANPPHVHLRSLRVSGEVVIQLEEDSEGCVESWFEADGRLYAVLPCPSTEPESKEELAPFRRGVRHIVGYGSDAGLQRELDEDSLLALSLAPMFESNSRPSLGLYAVADGMGGHEGGEVASRLAIERLADTIVKRLFLPELGGELVLPETPSAMLEEAIQSINARLNQLQQATGSDLGTTLTAAMVRDGIALVANVGDSRTYLWRDAELIQITVDHSLVAQLVAAGMLEPHEIYTHPDKSAIYRSLGHAPDVEVDIFEQPLLPGDRLLLCCDGAWEMLRDQGIEEILLSEADPQRACNEIVRRSNLAGGEDNISVVIVQFEELGNR